MWAFDGMNDSLKWKHGVDGEYKNGKVSEREKLKVGRKGLLERWASFPEGGGGGGGVGLWNHDFMGPLLLLHLLQYTTFLDLVVAYHSVLFLLGDFFLFFKKIKNKSK